KRGPDGPARRPDPVARELLQEAGAREPELLRGLRLVPAAAIERVPDHVALERLDALVERPRARLARPVGARSPHPGREVLRGDGPPGENHRAFDLVLELADVAGPVVRRQEPHRRTRDLDRRSALVL